MNPKSQSSDLTLLSRYWLRCRCYVMLDECLLHRHPCMGRLLLLHVHAIETTVEYMRQPLEHNNLRQSLPAQGNLLRSASFRTISFERISGGCQSVHRRRKKHFSDASHRSGQRILGVSCRTSIRLEIYLKSFADAEL